MSKTLNECDPLLADCWIVAQRVIGINEPDHWSVDLRTVSVFREVAIAKCIVTYSSRLEHWLTNNVPMTQTRFALPHSPRKPKTYLTAQKYLTPLGKKLWAELMKRNYRCKHAILRDFMEA